MIKQSYDSDILNVQIQDTIKVLVHIHCIALFPIPHADCTSQCCSQEICDDVEKLGNNNLWWVHIF